MPNMGCCWTREEEKAFENAIAVHSISEPDDEQWDKIASVVPSKTLEEIKQHFQALVEDVGAIEAGKVALPKYGNEEALSSCSKDDMPISSSKDQRGSTNGHSGFVNSSMGNGTKGGSKLDQERKKGIPWTEEEHRLFLLGLDKFGKGDWRSISRNFVITRTPTQVASHAQKYFIRLNSMNRDRRRSSIHDITSVNGGGLATNQAPITGQQGQHTNTSSNPPTPNNKHRAQTNVAPGLSMYGTQMGHPVSAAPPPHPHHHHHHHMGPSAVGTPVMLPPPHHHPPLPHYVVPVAYPMPPPVHR